MQSIRTEERHDNAKGLDAMHPAMALRLLLAGQQAAARAVDGAIEQIALAASLAAASLQGGGRLAYAGAGSSGLMAMSDALELPGTYGISRDRILILLAGGQDSLHDLAGGFEDDTELARSDVRAAGIGKGDCILSISASGSTPYALAAADEARKAGAKTVAIANNRDALLFDGADAAILLQTPPEVISGSTRMGAGTAQKIALNMFSTLIGIHLGHVHDGHMVNLRADNIKLRGRALRIVCDISGVTAAEAGQHLSNADNSVKVAILLAGGAATADRARALLDASGQNLRRALAQLDAR